MLFWSPTHLQQVENIKPSSKLVLSKNNEAQNLSFDHDSGQSREGAVVGPLRQTKDSSLVVPLSEAVIVPKWRIVAGSNTQAFLFDQPPPRL